MLGSTVVPIPPLLTQAEAHRALGAEQGDVGSWHLKHIPHCVPVPCATDGRGQGVTNEVTKEV